jgi:hypothetical protein
MKKAVFLQVFLFLSSACMFAQNRDIVRVKAGEDPATSYSPYGFYRFPAFAAGVAYMKNGEKTAGRFNYHLLNGEVQFISPKGDTLALAEPFSIKYITIDSNLFYYADGYLEILMNNDKLKLARKLQLNVTPEKIGAYGQASPSGSIRTPNRLIVGNNGRDLSLNQDLVIQKQYSYYWLDQYNTVLKATKTNLLKLLDPDKKTSIDNYLNQNKIDFRREEDLKRLLEYAVSIK